MPTMIVLAKSYIPQYAGQEFDVIVDVPENAPTEKAEAVELFNRIRMEIRSLNNNSAPGSRVQVTVGAGHVYRMTILDIKKAMAEEEGIEFDTPGIRERVATEEERELLSKLKMQQ